jgi:hypothetical protein
MRTLVYAALALGVMCFVAAPAHAQAYIQSYPGSYQGYTPYYSPRYYSSPSYPMTYYNSGYMGPSTGPAAYGYPYYSEGPRSWADTGGYHALYYGGYYNGGRYFYGGRRWWR